MSVRFCNVVVTVEMGSGRTRRVAKDKLIDALNCVLSSVKEANRPGDVICRDERGQVVATVRELYIDRTPKR